MSSKTKYSYLWKILHYIFISIGAVLAATALDVFLIPNNIIDGGVVGISIMAAHLTPIPVGVYTFILNIPFLYIGYKHIGKSFVIASLFASAVFSFCLSVFDTSPGATHDVLLATIFGGILLGIGVGIIIRYGGSLDGTEMIAIVINKNTFFSVGQIVMFFNFFILSAAGLIFGWDKAMYSLVTYFIAFKVIDIVVEGLEEGKAAMIVSDYSDEIAEVIMNRLGRGVTFLHGAGGFLGKPTKVIYTVVTRIEIAKLKEIVKDKDENAFVTFHDVSDVLDQKHKKKSIH